MGKFRHTLRRWRSAIFGNKIYVVSRMQPSAWEPPDLDLEPFLDLSTVTVTGTWMDLPQEIVNHILFLLGNDLKSLKACSLTCKTMFVSTRPIIHRKVSLTYEQNWEVLTLREKQRYIRGDRQDIALKVLYGIAAHGLLPYGRHLTINTNKVLTPANLQPFNHHFQRLDRIQELSIYWLDTPGFLEQFDTFFENLVPTLRSLHLARPTGDTRDILDFICRFPHLEDLSFSTSSENFHDWETWRSASLPIVKKIPPFRGRLKLGRISEWHGHILQQLISLPGKPRFRFVDFQSCPAVVEQLIIDTCSGTIETLSTTWKKFSIGEKGLPFNLTKVKNLRSLALRVDFEAIRYPYNVLSQTLHTITSPSFSEFVLEVGWIPWNVEPAANAQIWWGTWTELDKMFEGMDVERGFKVIIRTERVDNRSNFIAQARDRLPLMDARNGLIFEIGQLREERLSNYW